MLIWRPSTIQKQILFYIFFIQVQLLEITRKISEHQSTCTMYVENYEIEYHDSEDILVRIQVVFSLFDFDYVL